MKFSRHIYDVFHFRTFLYYYVAIKQRWPNVKISGCYFHFKRAVQKKIRKCGLSRLYKKNLRVNFVCKRLMHLPLLPNKFILQGYSSIKAKVDANHELSEQMVKIFEYFEKYWKAEVNFIKVNEHFVLL